MSEPQGSDGDGQVRPERPAARDPRPLFRDEKPAPSGPQDATVHLPVPPARRPSEPFPPLAHASEQPPRPPAPPVAHPTLMLPTVAPGVDPNRRPPVAPPPVGPPPPARPTGRPGKPPKPPRRHRWTRRLAIAFVLLVLLPMGLYFIADSRIDRVNAFPASANRPAATPGADWLIVGSDSREGLSAAERKKLATGNASGQRTDMMMLLHVPASGGKPTLVSMPRDSYGEIPGHDNNRLNAAFALGGPQLLVRTVEKRTGIRIDHYAEIGFGGVLDVVNALGGVRMCVDDAMKDKKAALNLKAGCQDLDGAEALGYARTRNSVRSDLDRVDHQRELMTALMKKIASPAVLLNPLRLVPLLTKGAGSLTIDGSDHLMDLARFAFAAKSLAAGGVTTTVPIGGEARINGADVLTWDKSRSAALFDALRQDRPVPKGSISK